MSRIPSVWIIKVYREETDQNCNLFQNEVGGIMKMIQNIKEHYKSELEKLTNQVTEHRKKL